MKCTFLMVEEKQINSAFEFFQSIGMRYLNEDRLTLASEGEVVYIDLYSVPSVLEIYASDNTPNIWSISNLGITFYASINPHTSLEKKDGQIDGFIFCPMTNVRCISSFEVI
jgi:hypothetical protein